MTRDEIARAAESYLGTPYRRKGRSRAGLDCVGLLVLVARDVGLDVSFADIPDYPDQPDGRLMPIFGQHLVRIGQQSRGVGSVVVFTRGPSPCHAAIITTTAGQYVHAHNLRERVCRGSLRTIGAMRAVAFFDLPGLTDG